MNVACFKYTHYIHIARTYTPTHIGTHIHINIYTHEHDTQIESKGEKLSQTNGKIFVVIINIEYIAVLGYESLL